MSGPGGIAGDRLRSFVERIERLEEEIKGLTDDKAAMHAGAFPRRRTSTPRRRGKAST